MKPDLFFVVSRWLLLGVGAFLIPWGAIPWIYGWGLAMGSAGAVCIVAGGYLLWLLRKPL